MTDLFIADIPSSIHSIDMKAVQISKFAHPRDIAVSDVARPVPKAGEVLVEISATGLNFFE